jgi:mono/diheme cytochrome c family protein
LDEPKLPPLLSDDDSYAELISLKTMAPAVGPDPNPESKEPGASGLYRRLCVSCHGETGQGRGTVAASQNPYPRDFRRGIFKYKVTPRGSKPLKDDIARTLREGLAGTQMPLFDKLAPSQIDALVEYVVYLSIRGEFERKLVQMGAQELDPEAAYLSDYAKRERIYDVSLRDIADEKGAKAFKEQLELATDLLTEVADSWIDAEDRVRQPSVPAGLPVAGLGDASPEPKLLAESIAKGRELFRNEKGGGCAKCHGESAKGDGTQLPDYDDWTKEWTKNIEVSYTDLEQLAPFMARGGLKPQPLAPRNLVEGKFRGGRDPKAVHHRIMQGIDGSPMPAAALAAAPGEPGLQPEDVWHLVNYVLSLKQEM